MHYMAKTKLTFNPKKVVKGLLAPLPERSRTVVAQRFGLTDSGSRETLEAIGKKYDITRERVRQIENLALALIRKSRQYAELLPIFHELSENIRESGGLVHESEFLESLSNQKDVQNYVNFLLVLGDSFVRLKENDEFHHRWTVDEGAAGVVEDALRNLYRNLSDEDLVTEHELVQRFLDELKKIASREHDTEVARRWLALTKKIGKNHLGEWGIAESPNVHARGMRDYAYLVLRRHGSPMHFAEVAKAIMTTFGRKAHTATCHNELIKDDRFVLVGRGLYALKKWGYSTGTVRDVIESVLRRDGPLTKEEILTRVLKERYVKDNTILVNLQNNKHFKKEANGKYTLAQ